MCAHLLWELQKCNSLLNNHWQQNVGSNQKEIPHVQGQRRSPNKTVGGVKSHLESNVIPTIDAQMAQTKLCVHQDLEATQRLSQTCLWVFECLLWRHRSAVTCHGDRGSARSRLGSHSLWQKPCWRRSPLAPPWNCQADNPQTEEWLCQINSLLRKF